MAPEEQEQRLSCMVIKYMLYYEGEDSLLDCFLMQWWREADGGESGEGCMEFLKNKLFLQNPFTS